MPGDLPDIGAFAARFSDFMDAMREAAEHPESELVARIREHLGAEPSELPVTGVDFSSTEHANLQLALDAVLGDAELLGFSALQLPQQYAGLPAILSGDMPFGPTKPGPVQYTNVEVGDGRVIQCVANGIFLAERARVRAHHHRAAVRRHRAQAARASRPRPSIVQATLDAVARRDARAQRLPRPHDLPARPRRPVGHGRLPRTCPPVARNAVILPDGTLERLERHALGIAEHAERLRAAGRHLKRGVLLHGPPGTGKTLSINYVLGHDARPHDDPAHRRGPGPDRAGTGDRARSRARDGRVRGRRPGRGRAHVRVRRRRPAVRAAQPDGGPRRGRRPAVPAHVATARTCSSRRSPLGRAGSTSRSRSRCPTRRPASASCGCYAAGIEYDEAEAVERTEGVSGAFMKELMRQAALRAALEGREAGRRGRRGRARRSARRPLRAHPPPARPAGRGLEFDEVDEGHRPEMLRAVEAAGLLIRPKSP